MCQGRCTSKDIGPRRGMDCESPMLVGEENETSGVETLPYQTRFKALRESLRKLERKTPKRIIFTSGGLELLHKMWFGDGWWACDTR